MAFNGNPPNNLKNGASAPIHWAFSDPQQRGPIIACDDPRRNAIGAYGGGYAVYRALSEASGQLAPDHRPDLRLTSPIVDISPHRNWFDANKIVSLDPWGHLVTDIFQNHLRAGIDVRPTIAISQARLKTPEISAAVQSGDLVCDGRVIDASGSAQVVKIAIDPVWYLPGIARRLEVSEDALRSALFRQTMIPEFRTRPDIKLYLPPVGGATAYLFGDPANLGNPDVPLAVRVHDECNGSDVFGSNICTCRPYLSFGIEQAIRCAQSGGNGLVVYFRKEGRALGEVTKFLVYNARKRQQGGDHFERYFHRTECVAGTEDARFQAFMPDVLHWLGVTHIHQLLSMSHVKYQALRSAGITVDERVAIPKHLVPKDAQVEIDAKVASGYHQNNHDFS